MTKKTRTVNLTFTIPKGTKFLLHDRGPFTSRIGKARHDWYKASLQGDGQLAADSATSGAEDQAEKPGFVLPTLFFRLLTYTYAKVLKTPTIYFVL